MRSIGVIAGFLLLGVFALIISGTFISMATAGSLSGTAQDLFDMLPTFALMAAVTGFVGLILAAFYQFVVKAKW